MATITTKNDLSQLIQSTLPLSGMTEDQFLKMAQSSGLDKTIKLVKDRANKNVSSIRNDFGLRFQEGFLENPEVRQKLVQQSIAKRFPGQDIQVEQVANDFVFKVGGSAPIGLDPKGSKDTFGEIAEQTGRFIEPTVDIGVGISTGNPLAVAGVAGGFQAAREMMEQGIDPERQNVGEQLLNIGEKATLGFATEGVGNAIAGKISSGLGKGARERTRSLGGVTKKIVQEGSSAEAGVGQTVKNAANILAEESTRKIEKGILKGFENPTKRLQMAELIQRRTERLVDDFSNIAKTSFDQGRNLAKREGQNFIIDMQGDVIGALDRLSADPALVQNFGNKLAKRLTKNPKAILDDIDLTKATPSDVMNIREFMVEIINESGSNPAFQKAQAVQFKTALNDTLSQLAQQGSTSAKIYNTGISKLKELNQIIPEPLQIKVLGKTAEMPSKSVPVTPNELLDKFSSKAFDERELTLIKNAAGIKPGSALERRTGRALVADLIETKTRPEGTEEMGFLRLKNLPEEIIEKAKKFRSFEELDTAQQAGFKLDPKMFDEFVTAPNSIKGGRDFNFRSVDQFIGGRRGNTAAEILGGKTGQEGVDLISEVAGRERIKQGKMLPFTDPSVTGLGRNILPVRLPGSQIAEQVLFPPGAQRATFTATGQLPEIVPDSVKMAGDSLEGIRNLIFGQARQDPSQQEQEEALIRKMQRGEAFNKNRPSSF